MLLYYTESLYLTPTDASIGEIFSIIDKDVENSVINLGAPFLFNEDNKTVAQCISVKV